MSLEVQQKERVEEVPVGELYDLVVEKGYLDKLADSAVVDAMGGFGSALKLVRADRITKIVYDRNEDNLAKLNAVYAALYSAGASTFIVLKGDGKATELYLGIKAESPNDAMKVFERALAGNFPGCAKTDLNQDEVGSVSDLIRHKEHQAVGIVTGVPSLKIDDRQRFTQGLEKIIEAMGERKYVAILLATPIGRNDLDRIGVGYANIYSQLSLLDVQNVSYNSQTSKAVGSTLTKGFSKAFSKSIALTTTVTEGTSSSLTETHTVGHSSTKGHSHTTNFGAVGSVVGVGAGAGLGFMLGGPLGAVAGGFVGGKLGGVVGGICGSSTNSRSETDSVSDSTAKMSGSHRDVANGTTDTKTDTETLSESLAASETDTLSKGTTYQYGLKNRGVEESLKIIDAQLERIKDAKNFGAWNFAAYFVADETATVRIGTHTLSGILRGEDSGLERCAVALLKQGDPRYMPIVNSLARFEHPVFELSRDVRVTPTAIVGTSELAVAMALPQKTLPAMPVFESVEFGRSVETYDPRKGASISIGSIWHLGAKESRNVDIDVNSLASHLFVTGSTGSGKSNFLYTLLSELRGWPWTHENGQKGVTHFLVVEPAKGEYKKVFGGIKGVKVYGTNPRLSLPLRINPFSFPDGVLVSEHIDRLVEILNAVWPMYAAMPAVLKDAVERAYVKCGWDLVRSTCGSASPCFPDFHDLLSTLPEVINESAYVGETKGNYIGSLVTRVKALTNGSYRMIFRKDELSDEEFFDQNVIIDLSRVGSTETKSLLMGVVFMKLLEHRVCEGFCNSPLRHVTVLEEAHNLLRKTSTEQSAESANLAGKSVEMMTNAIAEMRTFGEGFVIVDQAPGMLDPAVIRNTNTKVVFRLPDFDDRVLVGKAQNLTDVQIDELARLPLGCASVYQNNWQQAVLCKTEAFDGRNERPLQYEPAKDVFNGVADDEAADRIRLLLARAGDDPDAKALDDLYALLVKDAIGKIGEYTDRPDWISKLLDAVSHTEAVRRLNSDAKGKLTHLVFRVLARHAKTPEQTKLWLNEGKRNWRVS